MTYPTSAYREASGNVVLRSGPVGNGSALRFFHEFGGCPLEVWKEPYPGPVTNPWPGSALSLAWDCGQDPTQASAEGLLKNPIARIGHAPSIALYNYYIRETLLNPNGAYHISGFFPDFWLSHEAIDDAISASANVDHGWRTHYNNPQNLPTWNVPSSAVGFRGTLSMPEGRFYVGDQMAWLGLPWRQRVREYPEGRVAAKIRVRMENASADSRAGFIFKQHVNDAAKPGWMFYVTKTGVWTLASVLGSIAAYGKLSKTQIKNLSNSVGVNLELRTHNGDLRFVQIFIDGGLVVSGLLPGYIAADGPHFGLYAKCSSGMIWFHDRQVFDVAVQARLKWTALPEETFESEAIIERAPGAELTSSKFYRAGIGAFLNPPIYPPASRVTYTYKNIAEYPFFERKEEEGLFLLKGYHSFYVGNQTYGLRGIPICYQVDGRDTIDAGEAHMLMQKSAVNNEFYMGFNPFAVGQSKIAKEIRMVTRWQSFAA